MLNATPRAPSARSVPSLVISAVTCALIFTFCALHTPKARAQDAKAVAKAAYAEGKAAFTAEDWPKALADFERAYQAYPLPLMLFNIASAYERMGDLPTALERYKTFVQTGKDSDGDAGRKVKELEGRLAGWVSARVTSRPSGAQVRVGDPRFPPRAQTPATLLLPPSQDVTLTLSLSGYEEARLVRRFAPKEAPTVEATLKGKPAFVRVIGAPREAEVRVGGEVSRGLPVTRDLGVGAHELEVVAAGFLPERRAVTLTQAHTESAPLVVEISLSSSAGVGLLELTTDEEGAVLFIDGRPSGQAPFSAPLQLSEGAHLIELKGSGGRFESSVRVRTGEKVSLYAPLGQQGLITSPRVGLTLASLGAASLVAGVVSGALALSASGDLDECRANFRCARGQGELDRAQSVRAYSNAADLLMALGAVVGGGGAALYLWTRAPSAPVVSGEVTPASPPPPASPSATLQLSPLVGGAAAVGRFSF
jgi:hypothetical protein